MSLKTGKRVLFNIIIFGLIFVGTLVLSEIAVKVFKHFYMYTFVFREFDPDLGTVLIPNIEGKHQSCWDGYVSINSQGMRDLERSIDKPKGTFRIGVFGDSVMEAVHVKPQELASLLLEERLNREICNGRCEVLNFSVAGYSTLQELMMYQKRGRNFDLDLVLLVATPNDFYGNVKPGDIRAGTLYNAPFVEYSETSLKIQVPEPPSITERSIAWSARYSDLVLYASKTFYNVIFPQIVQRLSAVRDVPNLARVESRFDIFDPALPQSKMVWNTLTFLLNLFKRDVEADGAQFSIAFIGLEDIFWWTDESPDELEFPPTFIPNMTEYQFNKFGRETSVPVFNLGKRLKEYSIANHMEPPYLSFQCDGHFNPRGQQVIAESLYEFIVNNHLI